MYHFTNKQNNNNNPQTTFEIIKAVIQRYIFEQNPRHPSDKYLCINSSAKEATLRKASPT